MDWLSLTILAQAVYAVVIFIDKYILEKEISDYKSVPIYSAIVGFILGCIIWIITGFPILNFKDTFLILLTGIFTLWGLAAYFKALSDHESSKITILFQLQPIVTLVLAFFILNEKISVQQLIGFLLILVATVGISLEKKMKRIKLSNVFFWILLTDFFWAAAYVAFKFVVDNASFSNVISYEGWGIGLGGLLLYIFSPSIQKAFKKLNKQLPYRVILFIAINEVIFLISRFLKYLAISIGPVSLVDVVSGAAVVFFAVIYGWFLTMVAPKIFKENITMSGLFKKGIMAFLVLLGLWLIQE